jgi:hypothetical protein
MLQVFKLRGTERFGKIGSNSLVEDNGCDCEAYVASQDTSLAYCTLC